METTLKILILEDSQIDAEIIKRLLIKEEMPCEFHLATNKMGFINALDEFVPDVILSDHSLPKFNSADALVAARQKLSDVPFIMVTGTVSEEFAVSIIKQGADDYILKDRLARLPAAINTALKQRQAEKEKQKAEQQREFDSNNLSALINNTRDLLWSVDKDLKLITCNDAFNHVIELMSGKPLVKGHDMLSTQFTPEQRERYKMFYQRALSGETFTIIDHFEGPVQIWTEISFYPIRQEGAVIGTACFSRDITERKKAEETLRSLEEKIQEQKIQEQKKIARALIKGQEKERNHIGKELHDNINQILAGTKIYLSIAGKKSEEVKEIIKYPMQLIDSSIEEIRALCAKLVTPVKNINLEELIRDLAIKMSHQQITKTKFTYEVPDKLLSDDLKLNIYRIIQEQVNNISKYAEAKNVNIAIETEGKTIRIVVEDDGKGFDLNVKRQGIGISNIINRAETFNGTVEIMTSPGNGYKTLITIPY